MSNAGPPSPDAGARAAPPLDLAELVVRVSAIAERAGDAILEVYGRDFEVALKDDASPLTQADLASHDLIAAALAELTPDVPVLSEEAVNDAPFDVRSRWHRFWLVDPLDGTKEFVKRNGEFTVNIALIEDGRPVLGVVQAPVLGVVYAAARGHGASRAEDGGAPRPIRARAEGGGTLRVVASRSHVNADTAAFLAALEARGPVEVVSRGSALKICLVADGTAHLYPRLGPTMEWDTGAAHCVALEAGGDMVDLAGDPLRYNKPSLLNPHFLVSGDDPTAYLELLSGHANGAGEGGPVS